MQADTRSRGKCRLDVEPASAARNVPAQANPALPVRWVGWSREDRLSRILFADHVLILPTANCRGHPALAQAIRLARWHSLRTFAEPIVWVLHLAYAWLPIGLALKAVHLLTGAAWAANWLHALGMGAAATMIVAVITRASLGHTGRSLAVPFSVALAYGLLGAAVFVRVFGPAVSAVYREWTILAAGMLWVAAFAPIIRVYTPILMRPRVDGKPG